MCISLSGGLYFSALATSNCHLAYCIGLVVCFLRATDRALYKTPTSLVSSRLHFPFSSPCLGLFHAIPRSAFEGFGALILGLPLDFDFNCNPRPSAMRVLLTNSKMIYNVVLYSQDTHPWHDCDAVKFILGCNSKYIFTSFAYNFTYCTSKRVLVTLVTNLSGGI